MAEAAPDEAPEDDGRAPAPPVELVHDAPVTWSRGQQVLHPTREQWVDVVRALHVDGFHVCIDLTAVGDWAERADISYASYQELAAHPRVIALLEQAVDQVNRDLAAEPAMAGAQIRRFLVLHKELDADDGELTRTQKVRRGFIADMERTELAVRETVEQAERVAGTNIEDVWVSFSGGSPHSLVSNVQACVIACSLK